ncbi:gonadotropin-releasing hormone II receptor [Biomphalaria glabrata]|nr:gonadotropin-releasing hormone II receptor [Biomphalaria glabrata]
MTSLNYARFYLQGIFPPHKQLISHGSVTSYPEVRWSTASYLSNAKMRTLKMTSCIVGVFILCWTPYFAIILYHWIAKESAKALNDKVKRVLFIFAVSNSCMDPLVYGMFTTTFRKKLNQWREYIHQKLNGTTTTVTT